MNVVQNAVQRTPVLQYSGLVITADDQGWYFETLSRARNGLAIVLDISADSWYVFIVLLLCFLCLVPVAFHDFYPKKY